MAKFVRIANSSAEAKVRHPLAAFGLVFLTLGIYYLVWYYKVNREMRDLGRAVGEEERLGRSPFTSLLAITIGWFIVVPPFVSFYRTFQRIEVAQEVTGTGARVNIWLGFILFVVGTLLVPIEVIYAQSELNRAWVPEADRPMRPAPTAV
jgi:hypothetical protein